MVLKEANPSVTTNGGLATLNPITLANYATSLATWTEILRFHGELASDAYVSAMDQFYRNAIVRYGASWYHFDIVNALYTASVLAQPRNYLEIGVRRGRSACIVARACPTVNIYAFDLWQQNYAGMPNPGPEFVRAELQRHGHRGDLKFFNGDSHSLLPAFFQDYPELAFDLITVDGDHSAAGAIRDMEDVIPHLSVGGVMVFDDISHPAHRYLRDCFRSVMANNPQLRAFEYVDSGYGVAIAIRHE